MHQFNVDSKTATVYRQAQLNTIGELGNRPGLIVVDLIRGFTESTFRAGSDLNGVVEQTSRLLSICHASNIPVIHVSLGYGDGEIDRRAVRWMRKAPLLEDFRLGSDAVQLDPRLPQLSSDIHLLKKGASAFFETSLSSILHGLACDTVVICGATTSGCIRATAVDAVQNGLAVLIPLQAVGDRAQAPHDASLFDIQAKYGEVWDIEDVVGYLGWHSPVITGEDEFQGQRPG